MIKIMIVQRIIRVTVSNPRADCEKLMIRMDNMLDSVDLEGIFQEKLEELNTGDVITDQEYETLAIGVSEL